MEGLYAVQKRGGGKNIKKGGERGYTALKQGETLIGKSPICGREG